MSPIFHLPGELSKSGWVTFLISPDLNFEPWFHIMKKSHTGLSISIYNIQHLSLPIDDFINVSYSLSLIALPPAPSLHIGQTWIPSPPSTIIPFFLCLLTLSHRLDLSYTPLHFSLSHWSLPKSNHFFSIPQISCLPETHFLFLLTSNWCSHLPWFNPFLFSGCFWSIYIFAFLALKFEPFHSNHSA